MALSMDEDLTAILNELDPDHAPFGPLFPGTTFYADQLPEVQDDAPGWKSRIDRLHDTVSDLPPKLHLDLWAVLQMSQGPVPDQPDHRLVVGGDGRWGCSAA